MHRTKALGWTHLRHVAFLSVFLMQHVSGIQFVPVGVLVSPPLQPILERYAQIWLYGTTLHQAVRIPQKCTEQHFNAKINCNARNKSRLASYSHSPPCQSI